MNLTSLCAVRQWKSLTTNVKQDSKTEFSWFLWNWEADQEFLWIQDKWHSFRTVLSWYGETVSRVRDLESWCHTVSMNNKQCKFLTDSDRHCSKSWKVLISDEQWIEIFFFFLFLTSFQCRTFFFVFVLFIAEQFFCSQSQTYTRATHTGWYIMVYHSVSVCETWWFSDDHGCV